MSSPESSFILDLSLSWEQGELLGWSTFTWGMTGIAVAIIGVLLHSKANAKSAAMSRIRAEIQREAKEIERNADREFERHSPF